MIYILFFIIIITIAMALKTLFSPNKIRGKKISLENFFILTIVYFTITLGFALIYLLFDLKGIPVVNDDLTDRYAGFFAKLQSHFYFSAMTLFSVGYGDVYPLGFGRMIAVLEALIGYTIPAAFVARAVIDHKIKSE